MFVYNLPPNVTSLIQTMVQSIIFCLKQKDYISYIIYLCYIFKKIVFIQCKKF